MILPRVVQPAIIKIPAFFALRCEGAGIHSKSDVEYARIANATDDPNIPKLNVPRNWADYIHDFFLPEPLCKYSHDTIVLLAWVAKSLFTTITLYPLLFVLFENCGAPDNNTKNLCAIEFSKPSTSASTAHGTFWTNKVHEEWRRWMRGTRILEQWTFNVGTNKISQIHN